MTDDSPDYGTTVSLRIMNNPDTISQGLRVHHLNIKISFDSEIGSISLPEMTKPKSMIKTTLTSKIELTGGFLSESMNLSNSFMSLIIKESPFQFQRELKKTNC